jgi:hypothetical protein
MRELMEKSCSHEKGGNSLATERKASVEKETKGNRSHVGRRKRVIATRTAKTDCQAMVTAGTE